MTARIIITLVLALAFFGTDTLKAQDGFCVMELNTENFFDPIDNPTNDDDFLPTAVRRWTWAKFNRKANNIGKTIAAVGGNRLPDIVALCEVENDSVMNRLTRTGLLRRGRYNYIMTHGIDPRGINVALLYKNPGFIPIQWQSIRPDFSGLPAKSSRDVLYVSGRIATGDTLDVFVCHFPSKIERHKSGTPYRERIAGQIRSIYDSLCRARKNPYVIITGDFNDNPQSSPLYKVMKALPVASHAGEISDFELYSMIDEQCGEGKIRGTYFYNGQWEVIDNIIVSGSLLNKNSQVYTTPADCRIFTAPFLLTEKDGEAIPLRTYEGMKYRGGFSDHLPLCARFKFSNPQ